MLGKHAYFAYSVCIKLSNVMECECGSNERWRLFSRWKNENKSHFKQEVCGPCHSPEEEFFNIFKLILLICYYIPLDMGMILHLNKFESPPSKNAMFQIWLKLAQWFWRRKFLKYFQYNSKISLFSPFEEGHGPYFEQTWIPFTNGCFMWSLV